MNRTTVLLVVGLVAALLIGFRAIGSSEPSDED